MEIKCEEHTVWYHCVPMSIAFLRFFWLFFDTCFLSCAFVSTATSPSFLSLSPSSKMMCLLFFTFSCDGILAWIFDNLSPLNFIFVGFIDFVFKAIVPIKACTRFDSYTVCYCRDFFVSTNGGTRALWQTSIFEIRIIERTFISNTQNLVYSARMSTI